MRTPAPVNVAREPPKLAVENRVRSAWPHTRSSVSPTHKIGVRSAASTAFTLRLAPDVGFPEKLSALRMSDNNRAAACSTSMCGGNLAGECALLFPINILRGDGNFHAWRCRQARNGLHGSCKRGKRRRNNDLAVGGCRYQRQKRGKIGASFRLGLIHLPISGNHGSFAPRVPPDCLRQLVCDSLFQDRLFTTRWPQPYRSAPQPQAIFGRPGIQATRRRQSRCERFCPQRSP